MSEYRWGPFGPIKGETYESARKRLTWFMDLHLFIGMPLFFIAITVFLVAFKMGVLGDDNPVSWFLVLWVPTMLWTVTFFWKTRDVIGLINNAALQIPRILLGDRVRDPNVVVQDKLPNYLRCDECGAALIRQRRMRTYFPEHCPDCGAVPG